MISKIRNLLLLLSLTTFIYILRDNQVAPTGFLRRQVFKLLQEQMPSQTLCEGVDLENDISQNDRDLASKAESSLSDLRDGNPFIAFIEGPAPQESLKEDYVMPLLKYSIPWIVFFGVSILGCFYYVINWCCMYYNCCGCINLCQKPKSNKCATFFCFLSLIFIAGVVGAAIAGIIVSRGIPKGGYAAICKTSLIIEKLGEGDPADRWIGVRPAADKLIIILDNFNSTLNSIEELHNNFADLDTKAQETTTAIRNMYDQNKDKAVQTRPDPAIGSSYVPAYIQNLGPIDKLDSVVGSIQIEMEAKSKLIKEASNAIDQGVRELKNNRDSIQKTIDDGINLGLSVSDSVLRLYNKTEQFGSDARDYVGTSNRAVLGVLIVELVFAGIAVLSIFFVWCGIKFCNKLIHLSWCGLGLLMILTWAISAFLFPFSLALFEGCQALDKALVEKDFYDKAMDKFFVSSDPKVITAKEVVRNCLFESGDLLENLQVRSAIDVFDPIFKALDDTRNLTQATDAVPDSFLIPIHQNAILNLKEGRTPDSNETVQDLNTLNGLTYANSKQCTDVRDTWVTNSELCPSGITAFTSQDSSIFNLPNPTCISFPAWGTKNINERYSVSDFPQPACGQVANQNTDIYLSNFVNRFVTSRQEVNTIFSDLESSLNDVSNANSRLMQTVRDLANSFNPIRENTLAIYKAIADKDQGLIYNTNCTFIRESVRDLHDSLCIVFISSVFETSVTVIVVSFMGFFATLTLFCLAKRFVSDKEGEPAAKGYKKAQRTGRQNYEMSKV